MQALWVDTAAPAITLNNSAILTDGYNTTATAITFNWTATDNVATSFYCNLTLDGVINNTGAAGNLPLLVTNDTLINRAITNIADGTHLWNVTCWDPTNATSNTATSATRYFTVDTVSVNDITPTIINNSNFSSSTVYINWTVTDATSTVVNCSLVVDNALNLTAWKEASATGASASQSVAGLSEGWHTWYVNCTDIVGNKNATGSLSPLMRSFYVDLTDPVPTLTLSSTSINLRATETITCTAQDRGAASPASFTVKLPSGDYSSDLDGTFTDTSLVGTYTVVCSTTDASGRSPTPATSTFTAGSEVNANTGSTGGSSSAPTASSSTTLSVLPDVPGIVTVSNSQIAVNEVALDVSEAATGVKITVSAISTLPSTTPASEGTVYKYVQITKTNLDDAKLNSAKISFFVTKAWLTEKGLDSSDVELRRYTTMWVSLPTIVKTSDATKVYFEATTPGFSYFAISVKEAAAPAEEAPVEEAPAEEAPVEEAPAEAVPVEPVAKTSNTWMFVLLGLVVVGVIVALVVKKKKK